jgi:hypothetical protein
MSTWGLPPGPSPRPNDGAKPPEPAHSSGAPPAGWAVSFSRAGGVTRRELHERIIRQERS